MENQSKASKFISRQTARMMANQKKVRIFLIIFAVLGIVSMIFALNAVDKRVNPQGKAPAPVSQSNSAASSSGTFNHGDFTFSVKNNGLVLESYNGSSNAVEIPLFVEGYAVREIGANAFMGNKKLSSVTIPNSVGIIGESAFYGCSSLVDVTLPLGLESISTDAFANCRMLRALTLPSNLKSIHPSAFTGCAAEFTLHVFSDSAGESFASSNGYSYDYAAEELIG